MKGAVIHSREGHIYSGRHFVLVLDLCLGERRRAVQAPVHGLEALVQVTVGDYPAQGPNDICFKGKIHRQVRVGPVAHNAHAHEIVPLLVYLFARILPTAVTKLPGSNLVPGFADLLLDVEFNRQAMTVPARYIGRIKPREGSRLHDEILEDFIYRVTNV